MAKSQKIIWLPEAAEDLTRLRQFLQPKNPESARRAAQRILTAIEGLRRRPQSGRPLEDPADFRDLVLPFGAGAYVLRYRLFENALVVVRVWHNREKQ